MNGIALIFPGSWTETDDVGFNYYGFATRDGVEGPIFDTCVIVTSGVTRFFYKDRD